MLTKDQMVSIIYYKYDLSSIIFKLISASMVFYFRGEKQYIINI